MITIREWLVLLAMFIVIFIANVDATAVNLALPEMTNSFKLKDWMSEWVINGYLISSACFFVIGGRLGDSFGKRKIFIIGLSIFIGSSLLACIATNSGEIILARIVQGFSFALTYPMSVIILTRVFPKNKQGLAMALVVSASGFSIAAGPVVGGLLLHWLDWRAIFGINIPLGLVATLITWLFVKEDSQDEKDNPFKDILGSLLLMGCLFYFIYNLNHLTDSITMGKLGQLSILLTLFLCFFIYETKIDHPLFNKVLFKQKGYVFSNIIRMLCQFIFIGLLFTLPVTLQNIYGISPLDISLILLPLTILMGMGSIGVGNWIAKINPLMPIILGSIILLIACLWLSFMPLSLSKIYLEIGLAGVGMGFALTFPGLNTIALTGHNPKLSGQAFGLYYTNATLAGAASISISAGILKFFSQWHVLKASTFNHVSSGLIPINLKLYSQNTLNFLYQSFHKGWSALFWFYSVLMLIVFILSLSKRKNNGSI